MEKQIQCPLARCKRYNYYVRRGGKQKVKMVFCIVLCNTFIQYLTPSLYNVFFLEEYKAI
jgi:hypothetical protein